MTLSGEAFIHTRGTDVFLTDVAERYESRVTESAFTHMKEIAQTYVDHAEDLVYGNVHTAYNAETTDEIDCSSFVQLVLSGVPYGSSRYAGADNRALYSDFIPFPDNPYSGKYGPERYLANELARWAEDSGFAYVPAADGSDLKPGDVLFFSTDTENDFYRNVTHTAIVLAPASDGDVSVVHGNNYDVVNTYTIRLTASTTISGAPNPYRNALVLAARFPVAVGD